MMPHVSWWQGHKGTSVHMLTQHPRGFETWMLGGLVGMEIG